MHGLLKFHCLKIFQMNGNIQRDLKWKLNKTNLNRKDLKT